MFLELPFCRLPLTSQRLHWAIQLVYIQLQNPPFLCVCGCSWKLFTYRHLHFLIVWSSSPPSYSRAKERPYLCKVLGNFPSSFQHTGAYLTFTWAPSLSSSRLQHLWSLNSLSVSPSTCQRQPATDCQHIQIPAASKLVLACVCIVRKKCLQLLCCCFLWHAWNSHDTVHLVL